VTTSCPSRSDHVDGVDAPGQEHAVVEVPEIVPADAPQPCGPPRSGDDFDGGAADLPTIAVQHQVVRNGAEGGQVGRQSVENGVGRPP
jgi:hypothetical protein